MPSARCPCHLLGVDTVCPPLPQRTWRLRGASPATGSGSQGRCQQGCDWSHKGVTPEPAFPRPAALGPVSDRGWGSQASCSSAAETRWPRQRGAFRIKGPRPHGGSWDSVCWGREGRPAWGAREGSVGTSEAVQAQEGQRRALLSPCGRGEPPPRGSAPGNARGSLSLCRLVPATSPLGTHFSPPPWPPDDVATAHTWRLPAGERAPVTSPL